MGWSAEDIPSQTGRTAIVTGGTGGLGLATARELARAGARVMLTARDPAKGEEAAAEIRGAVPDADLEVGKLDLADLASVREFARACEAEFPEGIDLLINNAGVMATPKRQTADGHELQFGTNHLGHFALTGLLLSALRRGGRSARVVTVSSIAHRIGGIKLDDLDSQDAYTRWGAYGHSKLANLLFAFELQRRLAAAGARVESLAAHPGYAATHLQSAGPAMGGGPVAWFNTASARLGNLLVAQSADDGALPTLYAATVPELAGGSYIGPGGFYEIRGAPKVVTARGLAYKEDLAAGLWAASEELTGVSYDLAG